MGTTQAHLDAQGWAPVSWIELVALLEYQDAERANTALPGLKQLHLALASKATAHLALVLANVSRSPWVLAGALSSDADKAKKAAGAFLLHLDSTAPPNRTPFERHVAENDVLRDNLTQFATRVPPVALWQGQGAFKPLFQFLALRFLLAPDQVLDCERVHARWQWFCQEKRNMRLPLMNGWLRLCEHLERHNWMLPGDVQEHLDFATAAEHAALKEVAGRAEVAAGMRRHVTPA